MLRRTFLLAGLGLTAVAGGAADGFASAPIGESRDMTGPRGSSHVAPTVDGNQASFSGGLGNTRTDVEETYGPPSGLTGTMLAYRNGAIGVRYTRERATAILIRLLDTPTTDIDVARDRVRAFVPPDSTLLGTMSAGQNRVADLYESARLATKVIAPHPSEPSGQFVAIYQIDALGELTQVLLAVGTVRDQN